MVRSFRIARRRMNIGAYGVCEPSSICIKGGLGTISSSRCQTTCACPGEPGRRESFSLLDEQSALIRHAYAACAHTTTAPRPGARTLLTWMIEQRGELTDRQSGGARRDRTDDLLLAKQALSQLSYGPAVRHPSKGGKWWAWEDLNFRPHAYQARALTN